MTTEKNPEAGNLGAEDDDAGSGVDVSMLPPLTEAEAARLSTSSRPTTPCATYYVPIDGGGRRG